MLSDMRAIKQTGRFSLNRSTISLTSITASVNSKNAHFRQNVLLFYANAHRAG